MSELFCYVWPGLLRCSNKIWRQGSISESDRTTGTWTEASDAICIQPEALLKLKRFHRAPLARLVCYSCVFLSKHDNNRWTAACQLTKTPEWSAAYLKTKADGRDDAEHRGPRAHAAKHTTHTWTFTNTHEETAVAYERATTVWLTLGCALESLWLSGSPSGNIWLSPPRKDM